VLEDGLERFDVRFPGSPAAIEIRNRWRRSGR
jgi:hypothetical protein